LLFRHSYTFKCGKFMFPSIYTNNHCVNEIHNSYQQKYSGNPAAIILEVSKYPAILAAFHIVTES